ncbi:MAG: hypothetical protein EP335_01610 [Alphaproteobacteria bacterium]|nr:MAG: hypothetical protein EP335_01610 [Alphaproteobacteria bacterium]
MTSAPTVVLLAAVPGTDFTPIERLCAGAGVPFAEIGRGAPEDETTPVGRLQALQTRILGWAGYGWADTRVFRQDLSRQSVDRRFENWAALRSHETVRFPFKKLRGDSNCLVVACDTLGPTFSIWFRIASMVGYRVCPLFLARNSTESFDQFKKRLTGEVGLPGGARLWLKHILLAMVQMDDLGQGHLAAVNDSPALRAGFKALLADLKAGKLPVPKLPAVEIPHETGRHGGAHGSEIAFDLVTALDEFMAAWPNLDAAARGRRARELMNSYRAGAWLYNDLSDMPDPVKQFRVPLAVASGIERRPVILHYHLFKNAGTSIDAQLKENFGQFWVSREFSGDGDCSAEVRDWIVSEPKARAFSSHSMEGPVPDLPDIDFLPVLFIRHPIDRAKSAYLFERKQKVDNDSTRLARAVDFAGYVTEKLSGGFGRSMINFSTARLASFCPGDESELERALRAMQELPFVGLVEQFQASLDRLAGLVRVWFPDARFDNVQKNSTRSADERLADRLAVIRKELGPDLYARLEDCNRDDIALYQALETYYRGLAEQQ